MANFKEYSNLINQRAQFYREENAKFERMLGQMKMLLGDEGNLQLRKHIENISKLTNDLSDYSHIDESAKLKKHKHYLSILKISIKYYHKLNHALSNELKAMKLQVEQSDKYVNGALTLSPQDAQQLEEKARRYEQELAKFEKKYPWLRDPEYNLLNIKHSVEKLRALKEEKENLEKELSIYHDLKPDIKEARQQLADLKEELLVATKQFKV